jgi:uncharacterized alkaline shock family protein YloU
MAQYVFINNYTKNGDLAISHHVFYQIAEEATNKIQGVEVKSKKSAFQLFKPISIGIKKGLVTVQVSVHVDKTVNINQVCLKIQEEVASALSAYTEMVPFKIDVKVANLI